MTSTPSDPAYPHIKRAQDSLAARDFDGARIEARIAQSLPPGDIVARNALGSVLYELGDLDAARAIFQDVLAENPRYADALNNLGNILARDGKPRLAREFYERALAVAPGTPDYLANLGGILQALGDVAGALHCFDRALARDPNHADARWNRGLARLLTGDLAGGFTDYEARWLLPEFTMRQMNVPLWRGEDLAARTLLLHSEQGYGDTIQMVRFAQSLAERGARIVLETHAPLAAVMAGVAGIAQVIAHGETLPVCDFHVPVMSLPALCGVASIADIPAPQVYIRAPGGAPIDRPPGAGLKVGLVWAGRATHKNDHNRSIGIDRFAPITSISDMQAFSLQVGAREGDLAQLPGIVDLAPQLVDFGATARAIAGLDLIVTVDTAVAHLAGAMGKETWMLVPFAPDWRWLLDRDTSPWYPSLRIFRQQRLGDWSGVMTRLIDLLAGRVAAKI